MYPTYMQYPQYPQRQEFVPQQPANSMTIRAVASRMEAESAQIPFDGSTHFFYDTSIKQLYSKTFNAYNGTAPLITYAETTPTIPEYVTVDALTEVKNTINRIAAEVNDLKKGIAEHE